MSPTTTTPQNTTKFLTTTNKPSPPVVTKAPINRPKVNSLGLKTSSGVNVLIYGSSGTGKTYSIIPMLRMGVRVMLLSSDFGGSGAITIQNELSGTPEEPLLNNVKEIILADYDNVEAFVARPHEYYPELWTEFKPTVFFWDGFSFFQTSLLTGKVGELTDHRKEMSEAREEGFLLEAMDWGMVKKRTIEILNSFLTIRDPFTGYSPIKFVTCLADIKLKPPGTMTDGSKIVESKKPLLQGAGGVLSSAAFSLVLQTKVTASSDNSKRIYSYITQGHDSTFAKNRGYKLQPEETSFENIWKELNKTTKG